MVGQNEQTRDSYLKGVHDRLDAWEDRVKALRREVQETRQLKSAMQQPVEQSVEPQLEALRNRIHELRTADADNWTFMRERVETAEAELSSTVDNVASAFDVR